MKISALGTIIVNEATYSQGDSFNIDSGAGQELIAAGKAELVPDLVANDITSADGAIDRAAYEHGMKRESDATGEASGLPVQKKAVVHPPVKPPVKP